MLYNDSAMPDRAAPPSFAALNTPQEACDNWGVPYSRALQVCGGILEGQGQAQANCIFDFCASGGSVELVEVAIDAFVEEVDPGNATLTQQALRPFRSPSRPRRWCWQIWP